MLFNSYLFVLCFLPVCVWGFHSKKKIGNETSTKIFLIVVSLVFLGLSDVLSALTLLVSIGINYALYRGMSQSGKKKLWLIAGLTVNILTLFVFKYTGLTFVPLGISFFTFTQIAFLMEAYRGTLGRTSLADYSTYVTFFPKIMQGPIMLPEEMQGQLDRVIKKRDFDWEAAYRGFALFVLGLSKKVLLADTLGKAVEHGYTNLSALHTGDAWILMLSYTLQLYFDFSGYCDMAMGVAQMLGFCLPLNFHSPYKAENIIEFWKGWHITLTRFFTKYLYIPLGGNRKGKARTYFNILFVFLVSGIWHGVGVTFVVWGMLHGVLNVITRWWQEKRGKKEKGRIGHILSVAATFLYVNVAWVFFRATSVEQALEVLGKLVSFEFEKINRNFAKSFILDEFWYVIKVLRFDKYDWADYILMFAILLVVLLIVFFAKTAVEVCGKIKPTTINTVILSVLLTWCILTFSNVSSFLYVNF